MNDKNEEKAVVSQGKSNKKRRFRPRNKNKQENLDQNAQNGEQKASQSVIDNFFLEPFDGGEQHAQNGEHTNTNKQNGKKNRTKNDKQNSQNGAQSENKNANKQAANAENQTAEAKPKKQRKPKKNLPAKLNGNEQWQQDIASAMEANKAVHELRLEPMKYLNSTDHRIRVTPLGGLGLIPDFDYVRKIKDKIKGVVITHAHEDHIGAVPYFYKEFKFPIYATPLPLGMINNKFEEHGLKQERSLFRSVEKRKPYLIGDFEVEWIHITHSIIDASALAITTKAGTIIHTGDFKIDHTPIDGYPTDLGRLAYYGERGVLCLMSDSTNSYREGFTKSESSVGKTFDAIFSKARGRVIMSTFSSNIHRVYQAIDWGLKYNRKVCVIGRSMERNLYTAMELGYIKLDKKIFIDANEVGKFKDNEVLIVTTGSQGETMSALYRMATDEHKYIKIKPTDQIIISSKAIPGNESSVSTVLNFLIKSGASVAYQDFSEIHVSGHAAQEEQKLMLRLIKPKFFLPVHGEYNHIAKHKETAVACGVDERNIYLMSDGDQMEICQKYMKRAKTVKTGKVFIDNQINKQISDDVVIDRQNLAEAGVVMIIAQISRHGAKLINKPRVISYGLVGDKQDSEFRKEMEGVLEQYLSNVKEELLKDGRMLEGQVRQVIRKHIFRKVKKYPTIVPIIYLM